MRLLGTLFDVEELLYIVLLFLVLFCVFLGWLAKGRIGELLGGFFRLLLSFFYCPYIYLKKTVNIVADFGKKREDELVRSHHYLGTRITMLMRAALIVTVVGVSAFFVVTGWEAMLPAKYYRIAEKNTENQLERQQAQLTTTSAHLSQLEQDWSGHRDSLIGGYKASRKKQIDDLNSANAELEAKLSSNPEGARVLTGLKRYLDSGNANLGTAQQYAQMFIASEDVRNDLNKYLANWNNARSLNRQLENMSEGDLRRAIQPDHESTKQNVQYWNNQVSSTFSTVAQIRSQMRYSPEALLFSMFTGAFICLLIIWGVGLFLESYTLATDMVDDIQKIRQLAEEPQAHSQAAAGGQR
jgi:hypothetical protein